MSAPASPVAPASPTASLERAAGDTDVRAGGVSVRAGLSVTGRCGTDRAPAPRFPQGSYWRPLRVPVCLRDASADRDAGAGPGGRGGRRAGCRASGASTRRAAACRCGQSAAAAPGRLCRGRAGVQRARARTQRARATLSARERLTRGAGARCAHAGDTCAAAVRTTGDTL